MAASKPTKKIASQSTRATKNRWDGAINWLLNSRHTGDPDIQKPFWAYVDGHITLDELDSFTSNDVEERRAELGIDE